jgi:hypothetical protein
MSRDAYSSPLCVNASAVDTLWTLVCRVYHTHPLLAADFKRLRDE